MPSPGVSSVMCIPHNLVDLDQMFGVCDVAVFLSLGDMTSPEAFCPQFFFKVITTGLTQAQPQSPLYSRDSYSSNGQSPTLHHCWEMMDGRNEWDPRIALGAQYLKAD